MVHVLQYTRQESVVNKKLVTMRGKTEVVDKNDDEDKAERKKRLLKPRAHCNSFLTKKR